LAAGVADPSTANELPCDNPRARRAKLISPARKRWVEWEVDPSPVGAAQVLTQTLESWVSEFHRPSPLGTAQSVPRSFAPVSPLKGLGFLMDSYPALPPDER